MAERRMYTKKITDSDAFIELSSAAQALYFHLNQGADDDGFNNQIQLAMLKAHASIDDLKVLLMKNFIIRFECGVIVIKHWRMHNTLRKDRYTPTNFQEELASLQLKDNGSYTLGCQAVAKRLPQEREEEISIGKNSLEECISKKERNQETVNNHTRENADLKSHEDIMREWGLSKVLCDCLKGFLRHCYLNKHIVSNEKLEDIIFRLVDTLNDDVSRIECINRAVSGGYFDIKA